MKSRKTGMLGALLVLAVGLMLVAFAAPASAHRTHHRIRHHGGRSLNRALSVNQVQGSDDEGGGGGSTGTGTTSSDAAGTIAAFDPTTGELTVALTDGSSITGLVTDNTEISCESTSDDNSGDDGSGSGGGDDGGGGGDSVTASHVSDDGGSGDGSGSGDGDGSGDTGTGTGDQQQCSTADLTVGAVVQEAELKLENGQAVFDEIQLAV